MSYKIVITLVSIFIVQAVHSTEMSLCPNTKGIYPNVTYSIGGQVCDASPCDCIMNCPALIDVSFIAPRYLEKLKPKVHASCMGVELDYDIHQEDACVGITNTQCPIVKNEKVNYKFKLTIPPIFPEVTVTLKFSIEDKELNEDVICFVWDIAVKRDTCPS